LNNLSLKYEWNLIKHPIKTVFKKKMDVAQMYKSQVAVLGGNAIFLKCMRRAHDFWDSSEPYWQAVPKS